MRTPRSRIVFGLVIAAALAVIVIAQLVAGGGGGDDDGGDVQVVSGLVGGEKVNFLENPEIQKILRDRYKLDIDYTKAGSIEMVRESTTGEDFLWPSNEVALALYEERNPGRVKNETIFNSPIVMYSWTPVVAVLMDEGYVTLRDDVYYVDMERMVELIFSETPWSDLGLEPFGNVAIISTDPTESNSGNMFYGLLANLLAGGIATDASIEPVLPQIKTYYESLGFLEDSSGDLWDNFVKQGMGAHPIIMGYESQLIEFSLANEANRGQILDQIVIIYPEPTVWSSHPVIALTDLGEELMLALQDEEIQRIAWEQHGFRSGLLNINNDPTVLQVARIPSEITAVISLPRPSVMEHLIEYLQRP